MNAPNEIDVRRIRGVVFDAFGTVMHNDPSDMNHYWLSSLDRNQWRDIRLARMRGTLSDEDLLRMGDRENAPTLEQYRAMAHKNAESTRLYSDVPPVLDAVVRQGYPIAVLSNAVLASAPVITRLMSPWTEHVLVSALLGVTKPDQAAFRAAGQALDLPLNRLLMIGDGPRSDMRGARDADLQAVRIDRRGEPPHGWTTLDPLLELLT